MKEQGQALGPGVSGSEPRAGDTHDHGNCELCDALEGQLAEARREINVHKNTIIQLRAERDALQARVEEAERGYKDRVVDAIETERGLMQQVGALERQRNEARALAERRKEALEETEQAEDWRIARAAIEEEGKR